MIEQTRLTLKSSVNGPELGHADSTNLLSADDFNEYWVDWGNLEEGSGRVTIGRRNETHEATFMENILFDLTAINAVTAKTTQNTEMSLEFFTPTSIPLPPTPTSMFLEHNPCFCLLGPLLLTCFNLNPSMDK